MVRVPDAVWLTLVPLSIFGVIQRHCFGGEGSHVGFAPVGEQEITVLHYLNTIKERASYEQLLSGYGLEQIYQALVSKENSEPQPHLSEQEISKLGIENTCPLCYQALLIFCQTLGMFCR